MNKGGIDTKQILKAVEDQKRIPVEFLLEGYDININNLSLGVLVASHSTLDVCEGAQTEGIRNFAVALKKRHRTYAEAFRTRFQGDRRVGVVQDVYIVDSWDKALEEPVINWVRERNGVIVPSRSLGVYLRNKETGTYDSILNQYLRTFTFHLV